MGERSPKDAFFCYFSRKNYYSNAHVSKRRPFSKKHIALMPIFCSKTSNFSKTLCSHFIFFKFHMKNTLSCSYLTKNCQFCQNYTILLAKKVNRMPFFPIFHVKITALMPMLCQKDVHSLKNTLLSYPYCIEKTSNLSKTLCFHVIFL